MTQTFYVYDDQPLNQQQLSVLRKAQIRAAREEYFAICSIAAMLRNLGRYLETRMG